MFLTGFISGFFAAVGVMVCAYVFCERSEQ
jgi:hypothetical protein